MKIVVIFDTGLASAGGKSNLDCPLKGTREVTGMGELLSSHFKAIQGEISAVLYCGMNYYKAHEQEVIEKMTAMVIKLHPDFVLCGPSFNFPEYSDMCAKITDCIQKHSSIPVCSMMAEENIDIIQTYKDSQSIIKMPKKGGIGLDDSFDHLTQYIDTAFHHPEHIQKVKDKYCY